MGSGKKQKQYERDMMRMTNEQLAAEREEREIQRAILEKQKEEYKSFEFQNPYEGMENVYEDLTVDQRAADFQRRVGDQQRANILSQLSGAAGTSGIAGLAQAMANQGILQAGAISASLAQQERQNQMLAARGASAADMAERGGQAMVQQAEMARQSTLLGMEFGGMAGANQAVQAAFANQQSAMGMQIQGMHSRSQGRSQMLMTAKMFLFCIPQRTWIDLVDGKKLIEDIKPGDTVIGYNGTPVKVLQKHEYLEDPSVKRFCKIIFKERNKEREVNTCDMHKIKGIRAKDITENVISKEMYSGVKFSYDILTEDQGYRINGIPVNSMIQELAELSVELKNESLWQ